MKLCRISLLLCGTVTILSCNTAYKAIIIDHHLQNPFFDQNHTALGFKLSRTVVNPTIFSKLDSTVAPEQVIVSADIIEKNGIYLPLDHCVSEKSRKKTELTFTCSGVPEVEGIKVKIVRNKFTHFF